MIVKTIYLHLLPRLVTCTAKYKLMALYLSKQNTTVNRKCTFWPFLYQSHLFNTHCLIDNLSRTQDGYKNLSP
jgi:hypothetical protein